MFGAIVSFLLFFISLLFWYINHRRKFQCVANIPGPTPLPFIGNLFDVGRNPVDQLKKLQNMKNKYGPIYKFWIGSNQLAVVISDPEMIETVLSSTKLIYREFGYDLFYPWLGQGILTSNGTLWHKQRKLLTSTFHFKILVQFLPIFNRAGDEFIKKLTEKVSHSIDLMSIIPLVTLDIICGTGCPTKESAMGTSVNAINDSNNEYVIAVDTICVVIAERLFNFWKRNDTLFKFSKSYKKFMNALEVSHKFIKFVITKRREKLIKTENVQEDEDSIGAKKKIAFLDLLLQSTIDGEPLTDDEIEDQVNTFMFAGHDTTSSSLLYALYFIAKCPDVQNRVLEEIQTIFGSDPGSNLTLEKLNLMKYTECVIKESLRILPTVPYFNRQLDDDFTYKGTVFPKGTVLVFFLYGLHRDSNLFEDTLKFNPERFLCENMNRENYFSFIPFSAGPRNCIGQRFAMYEIKTILMKIVHKFELSLVEPEKPIVLSAELIARPEDPILFKLKERIF